jgi:putative ATPase
MQELFERKTEPPLADRIRPKTLDEFCGQHHLVDKNKPIRLAITSGEIPSMIFWGPPGTGKTTLARIIASSQRYHFITFSAVLSGVSDVRAAVRDAKMHARQGKKTILFIDEIHRFNKAQQDAFLPSIEDGTITLIGATTENPSFEVISPLLSRTTVYTFNPLDGKEIEIIIDRAIKRPEGLLKYKPILEKGVKEYISSISDGDARVALNILEFSVLTTKSKANKRVISLGSVKDVVKSVPFLYDRKGEEHYNLISAFIKSIRGSDPDAALYWLARMLESGEDPLFIARRMIILASEDIGNADPQALVLANSCKDAVHFIGMPEGFLPLAQTVIYLATAPKSNSAYIAYDKALKDTKEKGSLPVPLHLRNPPTSLMKRLGYGKDYKYPHNYEHHWVKENYMPKGLEGRKYYSPSDIGFEKEIKKRMVKKHARCEKDRK